MNFLPERWNRIRARFLFHEVNERGHDLPLASVTAGGGVEFRDGLSISVWNPQSDTALYKRVRSGDFVIGLRSFQSGIGHSKIEGLVSPAYTVLRPTHPDVQQAFFRHYFKSDIFISQLENVAQGIRQGRTIGTEDFYDLLLPLPSPEEQRAIAEFLDRETARIDALINKKRRLRTVMAERLRILTSEVMTGHCDVTSGKEFEAALPRPIGAFSEVQLGRQRTPKDDEGPHMVRYLRAANVKDGALALEDVKLMNFSPTEQRVFSLESGDVLVTEGAGSLSAVGASTIWRGEIAGTVCFQNTLVRLRPRGEAIRPTFLYWWARHAYGSGLFAAEATGANIYHLGADRLRTVRVKLPSLKGQKEIVSYLDEAAEGTRQLVTRQATQLALLNEHRQALITAVVTGQMNNSAAA